MVMMIPPDPWFPVGGALAWIFPEYNKLRAKVPGILASSLDCCVFTMAFLFYNARP
jgi:hypothetical protein